MKASPCVRITLTANAGVILQVNRRAVIVDALHDWKTSRFSSVSQATVAAVKAMFSETEPDAVLVTHRHPDHCSELLMQSFSNRWRNTRFLYPESFPQGLSVQQVGHIKVEALALPHEGRGFENVDQRGYCITMDGVRFLTPGDCAAEAKDRLKAMCGGSAVDFAVMNFPWVTLERNRRFLLEELKPEHIIAVHIPFARDDVEHYRPAVFEAAKAAKNIHILSEPMQTLEY